MKSEPKTLAMAFALFACAACSSSGGTAASGTSITSGNAGTSGGALTDGPDGTVECTGSGIDTYAPGLQKKSTSGAYSFELVSTTPSPPAVNDNSFVVHIADQSGAAQTGTLTAALDMPQHGHSSPKTPVVSFDAASGNFTLDPMDLFMVGLWRITFSFTPTDATGAAGASDASASDTAVFQFCIE